MANSATQTATTSESTARISGPPAGARTRCSSVAVSSRSIGVRFRDLPTLTYTLTSSAMLGPSPLSPGLFRLMAMMTSTSGLTARAIFSLFSASGPSLATADTPSSSTRHASRTEISPACSRNAASMISVETGPLRSSRPPVPVRRYARTLFWSALSRSFCSFRSYPGLSLAGDSWCILGGIVGALM
ncbi:hypothetical protein VUR80DRAFT_9754 [Thermomyces stellatus]